MVMSESPFLNRAFFMHDGEEKHFRKSAQLLSLPRNYHALLNKPQQI